MPKSRQLVIGTAGHIDHGKSALVQALTGTDPDRLPEERARGMTIDLGFAWTRIAERDVWFVDVPGHERFVRNMVAGAAGVDAAILVVAADDSVMPQTREHAEILALLGVRRIVLAITKVDLVDAEWAGFVAEEAAGMAAELGLEVEATVLTSATAGIGMEALRRELVALAERDVERVERPRWFRLAIDRSFHVRGRGAVATGTVYHGRVSVGESLSLLPSGEGVRVRGLQAHHEEAREAADRMRLAVNVAGVDHHAVRRGDELVTVGYLRPTRWVAVHVDRFRMPGQRVRQRVRVRLHLGAGEHLAELRFSEPPSNRIVRGVWGQLRTVTPLVASWGQRFVVRDESGQRTLGGGGVVWPYDRPWSARRPAPIERFVRLGAAARGERLLAAVELARWRELSAAEYAAASGIPDAAAVERLLAKLSARGEVVALPQPGGGMCHVDAGLLATVAEKVIGRLRRAADETPRWAGVRLAEWPTWLRGLCPERFRAAVAQHLMAAEVVQVLQDHVLPPGSGARLSPEDEALLTELLADLDASGLAPPRFAELPAAQGQSEARLEQLRAFAAARGRVVHIAGDIWVHAARRRALIEKVRTWIEREGGLSVADLKQITGASRKYVVPLGEHLDRIGITRRLGDRRIRGTKFDAGDG